MKVFFSSLEASAQLQNPLLVLGNFDGVHRAHQEMFKWGKREAKKANLNLTAYTFEPHPVKLLSPRQAPLQITNLEQKLELLARSDVDAVIVEPFTTEFAHQEPEDWFREIVVQRLRAKAILVGYDFTFGKNRAGNIPLLQTLGQRHGISIHVLEAQFIDGCLISSTQIRQSILSGDLDEANLLLGRPFFIDGSVIAGEGRGKGLGFPTANLHLLGELMPPHGVYAGIVERDGERHLAVANWGVKPTFGKPVETFEVHLLDFSKDLRGEKFRFHFLYFLRSELKFSGPESLIQQIGEDVREARCRMAQIDINSF